MSDKNKWQEIADILGSESQDEIYDYFGGTTKRSDDAAGPVELTSEELDLPEPPPQPAPKDELSLADSQDESQEEQVDFANMETVEWDGTESSDDDSDDAFPSLSDLDAPVPPKAKQKKPKRTEKPKKAAVEKVPVEPTPAADEPVELEANDGHWNDLAAELGIASSELAHDVDLEEPDLVDSLTESKTEIDDSAPQIPDDLSTVSSLFEPLESDQSEEVLSSMFVPSGDQSFDEPESSAEVVEDFVDEDAEFIEFDVQDLDEEDSGSSDRRRNRKRKRSQPTSDLQETEEEQEEEKRPRRRRERSRRGRRDGQQEERASGRSEVGSDSEQHDDQPRRRKSRSRDDNDQRAERDSKVSATSSKKSKKNVPTWSEAVDSIIDGNLSSRKKSTGQRRRRGNRNN